VRLATIAPIMSILVTRRRSASSFAGVACRSSSKGCALVPQQGPCPLLQRRYNAEEAEAAALKTATGGDAVFVCADTDVGAEAVSGYLPRWTRAQRMEIRPARNVRPADGDRLATKYEDQYPGSFLTSFEPHLEKEIMSKLEPATRRAHGAGGDYHESNPAARDSTSARS
jgi:hypothetical protein